MSERANDAGDSMWRWWPCFIGGFCGPLLGNFLNKWLPLHFAVGIAFFIMWVVVGLIFSILPPARKWNFMRWVLGGALGALVAGVVAFFFPWK